MLTIQNITLTLNAMKTIILAALLAVASTNVMADAGYVGECNLLVQVIRMTEMRRENGFSLKKITELIDSDLSTTSISKVATATERNQWHSMASQIFNGKKLSSEFVAKSVGRFCKPPYSVLQDNYPATASSAKNDEDKMHVCAVNSTLYEAAANWRDSNVAPENALDFSESFKDEIDLKNRKKIINNVYFDPAFQRAGGAELRNQMLHLCLFGPKNWKPLK